MSSNIRSHSVTLNYGDTIYCHLKKNTNSKKKTQRSKNKASGLPHMHPPTSGLVKIHLILISLLSLVSWVMPLPTIWQVIFTPYSNPQISIFMPLCFLRNRYSSFLLSPQSLSSLTWKIIIFQVIKLNYLLLVTLLHSLPPPKYNLSFFCSVCTFFYISNITNSCFHTSYFSSELGSSYLTSIPCP